MVSIENVAQALLALTTHEHGFNRNQYVNCLATLSSSCDRTKSM